MVEWTFPRHPRSVGRARAVLLRQAFEWRVPDETTEVALLLLSELATNACRHAAAPRDRHIRVTCAVLDDSTLRVEVSDADPHLPTPRRAARRTSPAAASNSSPPSPPPGAPTAGGRASSARRSGSN